MDLVAMLPWWGGVALAILRYLFLHKLAAPPTAAVQPGQMVAMVPSLMVAALANLAQYFVPFFCLLGALVSFLRRRKRQSLVGAVTQARSAEALTGMSWSYGAR